jgi:DNA ligase (NAD+)|tara:strand:+ start:468 stop:1388 length:921 start_codon:yes stop_codon:yes gene_type:complete
MREFLDLASKLYYEGYPLLSDAEFDLLADKHNYTKVGYEVTDAVPHTYQMYSLQKCFDITKAPIDTLACIVSPKLDGAAVSILYVNGELRLALTRGDGILGRDITDKMKYLVPNHIKYSGLVQITGEVVAPSSIPNARNYASGSLGLKDLEEFKTRNLAFVAYDSSNLYGNYSEEMNWLCHGCNFNVVTEFDCSRYPTDGTVYKLWDGNRFRELGYTSKHPRGAFALKEQAEGVETTLVDVVWQLGKSGVVSPVAILDPILIGDATVSRATLHNIEYIRDLNLEIGCSVEVIRSGEIIPRVVRRLD